MEEQLAQSLSAALQGYVLLPLLLVYAAGVVTSIGPCNLSMIPILMAYVGGTSHASRAKSFWLSLFFTLGSSTTFALLGVIVSLIGGIFGTSKSMLMYIAAVVSILVGLKMLRVLSFSLPQWGSRLLHKPQRQGLGAAYLMGLTVGLAGSQCGTPVLLAILTLVMSKGQLLYGTLLLFLYGLGRGIPVILAGTFTGIVKNKALSRWSMAFEQVAGLVLILVGLYFIWTA